jgi:anti-anti-sigma factor
MSLTFTVSTAEPDPRALLTGRIDRDAATTLDEAWRAAALAGPGEVVLDFTGVDYINSTGIALIVGVLGAVPGRRGAPSPAAGLDASLPGRSSRSPGCRTSCTVLDPVDARRPA